VAHELLARARLIDGYMTQEELAPDWAGRARARPFKVSSRWRACSRTKRRRKCASRRAPQGAARGETAIEDKSPGAGLPSKPVELDDMILLRSDGTPTYMLPWWSTTMTWA
jgi:glutamyl-tRNA synthetase